MERTSVTAAGRVKSTGQSCQADNAYIFTRKAWCSKHDDGLSVHLSVTRDLSVSHWPNSSQLVNGH